MTNVGRLDIELGAIVKVNGREWTLSGNALITDRDTLKPLVVAFIFKRNGKTNASGLLSVLGEDGVEPTCGDSVTLAGTYAR